MQQITSRIRTFGLMDCNQGELLVQAAEKTGMQVSLGMFLNQYPAEFNNEFGKLKDLITRYRSTFEKYIPVIIVGSETLYRKELNFDELAVYIKQVKQYVQVEQKLNIKITTADTKDQWYPHATLEAVDFMMVNAYPYWESIPVEQAIDHLFQTIGKVKGATQQSGKQFVLGETGWPIGGDKMGNAIPSKDNQLLYFNQFYCRAKKENLPYYWFSAFDESWKQNETRSDWGIFKEGGVVKQGYQLPPTC
ncbi:glycoside hydrolase [Neoconidiobolus thromboides FSU 785]|nr:glycoside hydrolase [Neoconidiobolus thromboides FSU 785]